MRVIERYSNYGKCSASHCDVRCSGDFIETADITPAAMIMLLGTSRRVGALSGRSEGSG